MPIPATVDVRPPVNLPEIYRTNRLHNAQTCGAYGLSGGSGGGGGGGYAFFRPRQRLSAFLLSVCAGRTLPLE